MGTAYELPIHPKQREAATGVQRFFYLDPPLPLGEEWDYGQADYEAAPFVIVSAATVPYSGPETYIFTADPYGRIASYSELDGSFRGGLSHEAALSRAGDGYDVAEPTAGILAQVHALGGATAAKAIEARQEAAATAAEKSEGRWGQGGPGSDDYFSFGSNG